MKSTKAGSSSKKKEEENKIKIHEFNPEIYPVKLWVVKLDADENTDFSWINERFYDESGTPFKTPNVCTAHASTYLHVIERGSDRVGALIVLIKKSACVPPVVAHEAVHAVNGMFEFLGVDFGYDHDEHYCYMLGWVVDCVWQVVTGKFRN